MLEVERPVSTDQLIWPKRPAVRRDHFHLSTNALKHAASVMRMVPDPAWFNSEDHDSLGSLLDAYEMLMEDSKHWNERQRIIADVEEKKANLIEELRKGRTAVATEGTNFGWLQNLADEMSLRLKAFQDPLASDDHVQSLKEKLIKRLEQDIPPALEELHSPEECQKRARLAWALLNATGSPLKTVVKRGLLPSSMLTGDDLRKAYEREQLDSPEDLTDYEIRVTNEGLWAEVPEVIMFEPVDLDEESLEILTWGYGRVDDNSTVPAGVMRIQLFPKSEQNRNRNQIFAVYTPTQSYPEPPMQQVCHQGIPDYDYHQESLVATEQGQTMSDECIAISRMASVQHQQDSQQQHSQQQHCQLRSKSNPPRLESSAQNHEEFGELSSKSAVKSQLSRTALARESFPPRSRSLLKSLAIGGGSSSRRRGSLEK